MENQQDYLDRTFQGPRFNQDDVKWHNDYYPARLEQEIMEEMGLVKGKESS